MNPKLRAFDDELVRLTEADAVVNREDRRVWHGVVLQPVYYLDAEDVHLHTVWTFKGGGSKAVQALCNLADKHGVALWGHVEPFDHRRLDEAKLLRWYALYGFRRVGRYREHVCEGKWAYRIRREPRTTEQKDVNTTTTA